MTKARSTPPEPELIVLLEELKRMASEHIEQPSIFKTLMASGRKKEKKSKADN